MTDNFDSFVKARRKIWRTKECSFVPGKMSYRAQEVRTVPLLPWGICGYREKSISGNSSCRNWSVSRTKGKKSFRKSWRMRRSGILMETGVVLAEVWGKVEIDKIKLRAEMGTLETVGNIWSRTSNDRDAECTGYLFPQSYLIPQVKSSGWQDNRHTLVIHIIPMVKQRGRGRGKQKRKKSDFKHMRWNQSQIVWVHTFV